MVADHRWLGGSGTGAFSFGAVGMHRVVILEDHADARQWLQEAARLLWPDAEVTLFKTLHSALQALTVPDWAAPDLCLIDLQLPDGSGVDYIRACQQASSDTWLVVTTLYDDDLHLLPALQAGAHGYLLKDESCESLATALAGLELGQPPLSASIAQRMLSAFRDQADASRDRFADEEALTDLSQRELECLQMISKGYKTAEVADLLDVSYHTAAKHVRNIYRKLGISSRAQAVQEALRLGLIQP